MTMNQVQFQTGLSMARFLDLYGTEAKCYRALYRARWPHGFRCSACGKRACSRFRRAGRVYYQSRACRYQSTLTSGTLFAASRLPLTAWFLAMHLLTGSKTNLSALELKRHLGVSYDTAWKLKRHLGVSYDTAWKLKHKVMRAMTEREAPRQLDGFVQIDDAYLGGERNGGKPERGSENKQAFVVAVSTNAELEHPSFAVIEPVRSFDNASMNDWRSRRLAPGADVCDGLGCFRWSAEDDHPHTVLVTGGGRASTEAKGARWVNVWMGNVKRAISGCYHALRQAKYARRYLAAAAYRFNRRFRLAEMLPRLARAMTLRKPWPEPRLRAVDSFHG